MFLIIIGAVVLCFAITGTIAWRLGCCNNKKKAAEQRAKELAYLERKEREAAGLPPKAQPDKKAASPSNQDIEAAKLQVGKKEGDTEQKVVMWFGNPEQTIYQPVPGFGTMTHFKFTKRLSFEKSEEIVKSLGGQLLNIHEAKQYVNGKPLFPGQEQWAAIKNPDGMQGNDYIQVCSGQHRPGTTYKEAHGSFPTWAHDFSQSEGNICYCAFVVLYKVI